MSFRLICADVLDGLRSLADESVHCVITSPPYWGLRDYGIEPSVWGGDPKCAHQWGALERGRRVDCLPFGESDAKRMGTRPEQGGLNNGGKFCELCRAWLGNLGLEPNPEMYVDHMVEVFREVRRAMHSSGTLWLNLGDCYISNPHGTSPSFDPKYPNGRDRREGDCANRSGESALKSKDLVMAPARVALALQADGWFLRSQIPWIKRNGMPESATDRPTSMVEYIFLFSKSEEYFYDREAAVLKTSANSHARGNGTGPKTAGANSRFHIDRDPGHQTPADLRHKNNRSFSEAVVGVLPSRARRNSDWAFESLRGLVRDPSGDPLAMLVNPQPFALEMCEACGLIYEPREFRKLPKNADGQRICRCRELRWASHFATFPEAMVEPCLLLGTSERGACPNCGEPWKRIVQKPGLGDWNANPSHKHKPGAVASIAKFAKGERERAARAGDSPNTWYGQSRHDVALAPARTLDWAAGCSHPLFPRDPQPCIVLDPFGGSGTTGAVAAKHGRVAILIERNPLYCEMARHRIAGVAASRVTEASFPTPPPAQSARAGGSF